MKLALLGYGKMGKMVETAALKRGHEIVSIEQADVCIDFSHPDAVLGHVKQVIAAGADLVIGTTGWEADLNEVKQLIETSQIGCVYSPNFSLGVHLFLQIVAFAARLMNRFEDYDVGGYEMHHREKVDSPSGTAKAIVDHLLCHVDRKKRAVFNLEDRRGDDELHFSSLRCGEIPGTHSVIFNSSADTVTLTHQAKDRSGFALGAVIAAENIHKRKGWILFEELIGNYYVEANRA